MIWALGLVVFLLLRLVNLDLIPVFADEAIYIRWAQLIGSAWNYFFIPLSDGKTPLFMWVLMPVFKVVEDPLLAGRLLSVGSGFMTGLGVLFLGWRFYSARVGLVALFLYIVSPYFIFFDRMALVDSMLVAFSIWSLNFILLLARYKRFDLGIILGYLLGGAMLTKTPGFFNVLLAPLSLILLNYKRLSRLEFFKFSLFLLVATTTAVGIYNLLRLGPGFTSLSSRNQDYVHSPLKLLDSPLDPLRPHFWDVADWLPSYLGYPFLIICLVGMAVVILRRDRIGVYILIWSLVPLLVQMSLLKTFTARYILPSFVPFTVITGIGVVYFLEKFKKKFLIPVIILILLSWPTLFNFYLLTDPEKAPLPKAERRGYLEDWTAGYNLKEIARFLENESKRELIIVGTEGSFGTLPDGLQIYLDKNRQVVVIGGAATVSAQLRDAAREHPTYFVANKSRFPVNSEGVELLKEYPKAFNPKEERDAILLFKVKKEASSGATIFK